MISSCQLRVACFIAHFFFHSTRFTKYSPPHNITDFKMFKEFGTEFKV